jgi:hypothetical protein
MSTHDLNGRAYAKLSGVTPGDRVEVDGGFSCMPDGSVHTIHCDDGDLYVECGCGRHSLDGQIGDDGDTLIGLYPAATSPSPSALPQEERLA